MIASARSFVFVLLLCAVCVTDASAQAPLTLPNPHLNYVYPAGGKVGTTFELKVSGNDLGDASELRFSHPGITAKLKMAEPGLGQSGPQPVYGTFNVAIADDVPPGVFEVRARGKLGLSNPRAFAVGTLPEIAETEPNSTFKEANRVAIGTTINGTCETSGLDFFKFAVKKGQRVLIDCWAFRLDSRLDGTLVLYDPNGRELERNHNTNRRDPLIDFTAPADGEYAVSLHDHMYGYYATAGECFYRLTISTAPYLDFVFPPADIPGSKRSYMVYGRNLPGGRPAPEMTFGGKPLEMLSLPIALPSERSQDLVREGGLHVEASESFLDGIAYRLKSDAGVSNPLLLTYATAPIVIEDRLTTASSPALVQPPCEYVGQFYPRGRRGWVSFEAKKGDVYWIEVISQRLGLPTDARLIVQQVKRDDKGEEKVIELHSVDDRLANSDRVHWSMLDSVLYDLSTHDPACRFAAPEDGGYRVMVQDLARPNQDVLHAAKGDPRRVYRLAIRRPAPDFRLVAVPRPPTNLPAESTIQATMWSTVLRRGGTDLVEVFADRRDGFDGEIHLSVENLPAGVTAAPVVIAAGQSSATFVLKAAEDAPAGVSALKITGKARIGETEVVRSARYGTMIWAIQLTGVTYHRSRLTDELFVSVIDSEAAPFSLQVEPNTRLETSLAGTVNVPVKAVRHGSFRGPLELFAYALPPTSNGPLHAQPKYHKPIVLPADKDAIDFTITVPGQVPPGSYSFFLSGVGMVNFARNPEKLKAAESRLAAIEKAVADNEVRLKAAQQSQAAAVKALADVQAAKGDAKVAVETKVAADKAFVEADQKAKQDAAFLATFRQELTKIREETKAIDIKVSAASNSLTLAIAPAPFDLQIASSKLSVRAGEKIEVPLTVKRKYGFAGPVQAQFLAVHNVPGINAPVATFAATEGESRLTIEAFANAVPGTHTTWVQATAAYNGQNLSVKHEVTFTIEPAVPAKK